MAETINREFLLKGLLAKTEQKPVREQKSDMSKVASVVSELAKKVGDPLERMVEESKQYAKAAIEAHKQKNDIKATKDTEKTSRRINDLLGVQKNMYKQFKSKNTMWVGISKFDGVAQNQLTNAVRLAFNRGMKNGVVNASNKATKQASKQIATTAGVVGGAGGGGKGPPIGTAAGAMGSGGGNNPFTGAMGKKLNSSVYRTIGGLSGIATALDLLAYKTLGFIDAIGIDLSQAWTGVIKDNALFQREMRKTMFLTMGFTKENRALEQSYMDITSQVSASGGIRARFQQAWLKTTQRGFLLMSKEDRLEKNRQRAREQQVKSIKAITTTSLATAKQLGIEGDTMNEMMMDWRFHLDLGEIALANIGREMQQIARTTGVTGSRLESAVKSANKFMEMMRSSANLTERAATNLIALSTSLEKFGVLETFSSEMQALTSRASFFEVDDKTRNFLTQIAASAGGNAMKNILFGKTLQSASNVKELQRGLGPMLDRYLGGYARQAGFAGVTSENLTEVIEKLTGMGIDLSIIDQQMKMAYGKGLGDIERFNKGLADAAESMKPVGERMDNLKKQIDEEIKAGRGMMDATQEMKKRFDELQTDAALKAFGTLAQAQEKGYGQQWIEKELTEKLGSQMAQDFLKNQGSKAGFAEQLTDSLQRRALGVERNIDDLLMKRGIADSGALEKMLLAGGQDQANAMRALNEVQQEIAGLEKDAQDPITSIQRDVHEINNKLGGWFTELLGSLSKEHILGLIGAAFTGLFGANIFMGGRLLQLLKGFGGMFGSFSRGFSRGMAGGQGVAGSAMRGMKGAYKGAAAGGRAASGVRGAAAVGRGLFKGGLRGILGGTTGGVALLVFGIIDGIMGGFSGYAKTADNFAFALKGADGKMKEATAGMKAASTAGGVFVGIMDGLTFGLLSFIGLAEPLQKFATYYYYTFISIIEKMWEGMKEGWKMAMDYMKPAFEFLQESWKLLEESLVRLANTFGFAGGNMEEIFMSIWETIGPIAKTTGMILGHMAGQVAGYMAYVGGAILQAIEFVVNLVTITVDAVKDVYGWFYKMYDWLVGHSIVPDLVNGIIDYFLMLPSNILGSLGSMVSKIPETIWGGLEELSGIATYIPNLIWNGIATLSRSLWDQIEKLPEMIWQGVKNTGSYIWESLQKLPSLLFNGMKESLSYAWNWFKNLIDGENTVEKLKDQNKVIEKTEIDHALKMDQRVKNIKDPAAKLKELERLAASNQAKLEGQKAHLTFMDKDAGRGGRNFVMDALIPDWTGLDVGKNAYQESRRGQLDLIKATEVRQKQLQDQINSLKNGASPEVEKNQLKQLDLQKQQISQGEVTKKTMEAGQKKGSIFVHDTHCEALLILLLKAIGAWDKNTANEYVSLQAALKNRAMEINQTGSAQNLGAFNKDQAVAAILGAGNLKTKELLFRSIASEEPSQSSGGSGGKRMQQMLMESYATKEKESMKTFVNMQNLGAFARRNYRGDNWMLGKHSNNMQNEESTDKRETSMLSRLLSKAYEIKEKVISKISSGVQNLGAFSKNVVTSAFDASQSEKIASSAIMREFNNAASNAYSNREINEGKRDIDFSLSRALYSTTEDVPINTNPIGDRDELKAQIEPLLTSGGSVEEMLARKKAGEEGAVTGSGAALLPDMNSIASYLTQSQSQKLDRMITLLEQIRDGQERKTASEIIGPRSQGSPIPQSVGVKRIGREFLKGQLDLQPLENAPSSVNTDGRGGY